MKKNLLLAMFMACWGTASAQVGIGTSTPDPYTILDMVSPNQGILMPRVDITSSDFDLNTDKDDDIKNQPSGLLVYNTGGGPTSLPEGYYYWNGNEWRIISSVTSVAANASLICNSAVLDPDQVINGKDPIKEGTILKIPYTMGNGGTYSGITIPSEGNPNVTAVISDGQFDHGSGHLSFYVSGTPTPQQATPTGITFDLTPFYDANPSIKAGCTSVTVGSEVHANMKTVSVMDNLKLMNDSDLPVYGTQITTPDGKFSVRAAIVSKDFCNQSQTFGTDTEYGLNLQIRNNTNDDVVIAGQFNWQWGGSGGNGTNALGLQPGKWSGGLARNENTKDIKWAAYVDGNSSRATCSAPTTGNKSNSCRYPYWGNHGVYASGRPERRTYSWTINDMGGEVTKTAYILTFTSTTSEPDDYAWAATCPNGICPQTKVFLRIEEIAAQ